MKQAPLRVLFAALLAAAALCVPLLAFGDAGNYSSSSDYGSGSGGSGSGESLFYLIEMLFQLIFFAFADGNYVLGFFLIAVVLVLLGAAGFFFLSDGSKKSQPVQVQDTFDYSKLRPLSGLKAKDPSLDEDALCAYVGDQFIALQHAWTAKDLEPMRTLFSPSLYAQFDRQLDSLRRNKQTNYVDDIVISAVHAEGWYSDGGDDCISFYVKAVITDYTVEDQTGKVVQGSKTKRLSMMYRWILTKSGSMDASATGVTSQKNCPNCGAQLDLAESTKCPFCDSIITADEHPWTVSAIQGLSQTTL